MAGTEEEEEEEEEEEACLDSLLGLSLPAAVNQTPTRPSSH